MNAANSLRDLYPAPEHTPPPPENLIASGLPGYHPIIIWETIQYPYSISHYNIYRSNGGNPGRYAFEKIADVTQEELRTLSWVDNSVIIASPYQESINLYYRVTAVSNYGTFESVTSNEVFIAVPGSNAGKNIPTIHTTPFEYKLYNNYPNPFNSTTKIKYTLKENSKVQIKIFDILGREVKTLIDEAKEPGNYDLTINLN